MYSTQLAVIAAEMSSCQFKVSPPTDCYNTVDYVQLYLEFFAPSVWKLHLAILY